VDRYSAADSDAPAVLGEGRKMGDLVVEDNWVVQGSHKPLVEVVVRIGVEVVATSRLLVDSHSLVEL